MKIALLQLNQTVGDVKGNALKIKTFVERASKYGVDLIVTPELSLIGYPPRDLLLRESFVYESLTQLNILAHELCAAPPVLVGVATPNTQSHGRPLYNSCALIWNGSVQKYFHKVLLPTYDVFDEDRYFEPAPSSQTFIVGATTVGISICEDIWSDEMLFKKYRYHHNPVHELVQQGAQCILNISASPFTVGKHDQRRRLLKGIASKYTIPTLYVNQVGGNDDILFDGRSVAYDATGEIIAEGKAFEEDIIVVDLETKGPVKVLPSLSAEEEVWNALILGTRDYVHKCGFTRVLLGLSGGIDSALTAAIATEALGASNVLGVLMPSPYTSRASIDDAHELARNLGIRTITIPIHTLMNEYDALLQEYFHGYERDITEENIQARIRGTLLMALSNKYGAMLLSTGNKSELAVGYCTLYGDMCGGLDVLSDVPKTLVYRIAEWVNRLSHQTIIPVNILRKPPSAELKPNQKDQDTLPEYEILDAILQLHIEENMSAKQIIERGFEPQVVTKVLKMVKNAEFKRKQATVGLKVTDRAFGTGWRMPIACVVPY
ncbi:MAG: NAD+ synthase [Bacteroidetes bacterium]|nr:NAD+ synthase [Bacteroidota bacterium]